MAYSDVNVPVIERINLPSGNTYYIADREIRDVVDTLSQTIAGGVSFVIAWNGESAPTVANIPEGVVVTYNGTSYTGTLGADSATPGAFYLVKSASTPSSETLDVYDEYVPVGTTGSKSWEKIGDTQVNLSDVVTNVTLNKQTDTVIGSSATFTVTQPTISLATGATAGTGVISVATGISSASASGDSVTAITGLGTPSTDSVIGSDATFKVTQPTITVTPSTTYLGASASSGSVDWNSKDATTVVTGYESPSTDSFVKSVSATTKVLKTASITGVSGSVSASKATAGTSQTTANGSGTTSTDNTNWLKGVSVSNGTLTLGAATMDTQTTTQYTFSNVTVPVAASATTVATGKVADSDTNGDSVVISASAGSSGSALTGLGTASTDSVIGSSATLSFTQPVITLEENTASASGRVKVATAISSASASGGAVAWNSKDATTVVTGYDAPTTDSVLGTGTTITVTPTTTNIKATASGGNTAWNSKDEVTVLTNATTMSVTKGS